MLRVLAIVILLSARGLLAVTLWRGGESDKIYFQGGEPPGNTGLGNLLSSRESSQPHRFSRDSENTTSHVDNLRGTSHYGNAGSHHDRLETRDDSGYKRADSRRTWNRGGGGGDKRWRPGGDALADGESWTGGSARDSESFNQNARAESQKPPRGGSARDSRRRPLPQTSCGVVLPRRILGGSEAEIDEFPWMALLQYRDRSGNVSFDCSGALISSRYVVTAAHCTIGIGVTKRSLRLEKVRLGEWDLSSERDCQQEVCSFPVQDVEIEQVVNHEGYRPKGRSQANDIALLRLKAEAQMTQFVQPICLPLEESPDDPSTKTFFVSGWGKTSNGKGSRSNIKMKAKVPGVSRDVCASFYDSFYGGLRIDSSQICAGGEEGRDTCQGDSGGPLMSLDRVGSESRWFMVGIVSSGPAACGVEGRPSLYTKVADFTDWVLDNMED